VAALLELFDDIVEPAVEHTAGGAAGQQSAQPAFEYVREAAAGCWRGGGGRTIAGRCGLLTPAEMLERLVGQEPDQRHGERRHAAAAGPVRGVTLSARPILHAVENVHQTHHRLLARLRRCPRLSARIVNGSPLESAGTNPLGRR
jgi:hypothetical protein